MESEKKLAVNKKNTQKPEVPKGLVKKEYTEEEKKRIANYAERCKREPLKCKSAKDGSNALVIEVRDKPLGDATLMETFGTPDADLQRYLLNQVIQTFRGSLSSEGFNYDRLGEFGDNAMALLNGIQPQDEIEGMLAVQMIAVHNLAMETIKRAMISDQTFAGIEANVNHATKMSRTFTAQMEALKRYRTGGQQKVIVEHVHVSKGGQAIVGAVSTGGRGYGEQEHE